MVRQLDVEGQQHRGSRVEGKELQAEQLSDRARANGFPHGERWPLLTGGQRYCFRKAERETSDDNRSLGWGG